MRLSQTILSILALGCLTILVITNGSAQSNFWMQTNGPFGGDIRAIMADSAGNVFAGTNGSGVYRSINDGVTWAPTGSVQEFVYGLASDPSIGFLYEATSNGVGRSSDLGVTWSSASVPSRAGIRAVCVSSVTHTVFCASVGHGVYRSADTGTTWLTANVGLGDTLVWSLTYNPATGHLFAGTNDSGVFRSTDDGSTWVRNKSAGKQ